jgi:hypothetical protein
VKTTEGPLLVADTAHPDLSGGCRAAIRRVQVHFAGDGSIDLRKQRGLRGTPFELLRGDVPGHAAEDHGAGFRQAMIEVTVEL